MDDKGHMKWTRRNPMSLPGGGRGVGEGEGVGGTGRGEMEEGHQDYTLSECWGSPPLASLKLLIFTRVAACRWRHSAAVCVSGGHLTAKTQATVLKMINKYLLRVLGVSPTGQPQVADIYTGCRMSLAPLCSVLGSRRPSH